MKQQLSLFALSIRASFYKILAVLALSGVVQAVLFHMALDENTGLETAFARAFFPVVFVVTFVVVVWLLVRWHSGRGSSVSYTLRRLGLPERNFILWNALYCALVYLIFWAVQLGFALLFCKYYTMVTNPDFLNPQTVFLAFYRSDYLHSLLPLAETSRWARNIAYVIGLGVCTSAAPCLERRKVHPFLPSIPLVLFILFFARPVGDIAFDLAQALAALGCGAYALAGCWKEVPDEI